MASDSQQEKDCSLYDGPLTTCKSKSLMNITPIKIYYKTIKGEDNNMENLLKNQIKQIVWETF